LSKKKKVPFTKNKNTKFPPRMLEAKDDSNYFEMSPVFKFSSVDSKNWTLDKWKSKELKHLIRTFKQMEQISWNKIHQHSGFRLKKVKNINYPNHISPDETIYEIRVCKVKRLFGFIDKNIFNIIWFDREHSVCPEGKNRKHG